MLPPLPAVPDAQRARADAKIPLRYEDVTQDGRLILETATTALGEAIWRKLIADHPITKLIESEGIVPILTRLAIEGTPGPFGIQARLTADGAYALARSTDDAAGGGGEPSRLYLNMWAELSAPIGRTRGTPPPGAGEPATAARLFAEHTFTRLFAPEGKRRVTTLPGMETPSLTYDAKPHAAMLDLPEGAEWLGGELRADATPLAFGICHTDSNQHVNSLVYPRMFEEAALRLFASLGKPTTVLARAIEIAFRKPFFAGQIARVALRAYALGSQLGAVGVFVGERDAAEGDGRLGLETARPHAYVAMRFEA